MVPEKSYTFASQNHNIVEHLNYKTMDELQNIQNLIYVIRGQRVMLDFDLAKIYRFFIYRYKRKYIFIYRRLQLAVTNCDLKILWQMGR